MYTRPDSQGKFYGNEVVKEGEVRPNRPVEDALQVGLVAAMAAKWEPGTVRSWKGRQHAPGSRNCVPACGGAWFLQTSLQQLARRQQPPTPRLHQPLPPLPLPPLPLPLLQRSSRQRATSNYMCPSARHHYRRRPNHQRDRARTEAGPRHRSTSKPHGHRVAVGCTSN